jgi:lipoprotein-releasing system permease protein
MSFTYFISKKLISGEHKGITRTILYFAIIAIGISVAVMICTTATIKGFKKEISEKIFNFWGHLHITSNYINNTYESTPVDYDPKLVKALYDLDYAVIDKNQKGKAVKCVNTFFQKAGIIQSKEEIEGIILKGVDSSYNWAYVESYIIKGNKIKDFSSESNELIISKLTSERMQVDVGSKMIVHFIIGKEQYKRLFKVVGLYNTGMEEYDKKFVLCNANYLKTLENVPPNQIAGYEVYLNKLENIGEIGRFIYKEIVPENLYVTTIREEQAAIFDWLDLQDINEVVILCIMILVAIINMITVLLILVLERTNMIGILKALGTPSFEIQKIFLSYAGIIILGGLVLGNVLGLGICFFQLKTGFIKLPEADYYLSKAPIFIDWTSIILINIGTFVLIFIFMIIPSFLVFKINPIKTITFK